MLTLHTWMRATDEAPFARFFAGHRDLRVINARFGAPVPAEADGVMITGGPDIAAAFHARLLGDPALIREPEAARDEWEFGALRQAIERGIPVLCVCKGMQVLNILLGGTLHLHISGHEAPEQRLQNIQGLRTASTAAHRYERVNSSHHQALAEVAPGLTVEAWCEEDGVIEQVRMSDYPWGLGVQYHPERDVQYCGLFEDFVGQIRRHAADSR